MLWLVCVEFSSVFFTIFFLAHHCCPSSRHCSSNKATDPISTALSYSQYAKDYLYSHSELFYLHIKTYSPQKNLALNCAVNYCLLLREIHICPSIGDVSTLHCRQQMGVHHGVMFLQHSTRYLAG